MSGNAFSFARLRRAWRRARAVRGVRSLVALADGWRWSRVIAASGEVDVEFVATQLGRRSLSASGAVRAYAFGGFRRGISIRPDFDETYAAAHVPDGGRVPAFYAHLLNPSSVVHDPEAAPIPRAQALRGALQWAGGGGEVGVRSDADNLVTVVVLVQAGDGRLGHRLRTAAAVGDRVVVAAVGVGASEWILIADAVERDPGIAARRFPASVDDDAAIRWALPAVGPVVVVDPRADPQPGDLQALLAASGPGRVAVPVDLAADGTIEAVGAGNVGGQQWPILAGHPTEDLAALGPEPFRVPARAGCSFAGLADSLNDAEIWTVPTVRLRNDLPRRLAVAAPPALSDDRAEVAQILERAGFDVISWERSGPRLRRRSTARRWAVKVASMAGPVGDLWGDTHFGEALAEALRRRGDEAVVDRLEAAARHTCIFDDIHLVVRGPERIRPPRHGVRVLWIISHPHQVTSKELDDFDLVFAASDSWAASASQRFGREIRPLLECTDATRYRPHGLPRGDDILFVGKSRDVPRRVVMAPIEAGIAVKVYGPDWAGFIPPDAVVAPAVATSALPEMYETAAVVLNDQWREMREAGFPAMRPFDVIAAGGRVISEHVEGLREALGPGVITYRREAELVSLLREDDLDHLFPSDAELRENAERVRRDHSFDARAATLDEVVSRRGASRA